MLRIGLLLGVLLVSAGFIPHDKGDIAFGLHLPAPSSQAAAERAAEAFVRQKLDYPPNTEFTFLPAVRAYLSPAAPGLNLVVAIWMCGTVRVGSTANTATWLVAFDWKRPDLIYDGGTSFERGGRFLVQDCHEIYKDGILVFH